MENNAEKSAVESQTTFTEPNTAQACCGYLGCDCGQGFDDDLAKIRSNDKRTCTDLVACFLFVIFLGLQIFWTAELAAQGSNPQFITGGYDFEGNYCENNEPLVMWPDVSEWKFRICTASCDQTNDPSLVVTSESGGIGGYNSTMWFDTWCLPDSSDIRSMAGGNMEGFNVAMGDIYTARHVLIGSLFMAMFLVAVYLCMIHYVGDKLVWLLLALTAAFTAIAAAMIWVKAEDMAKDGWEDTAWAAKVVAILIISIDVIFIIFMCCMYKRIEVSMQLIMQAAAAFWELKEEFIIVPILHFFLLMGYFAVWITMMIYVVSVSKEEKLEIPSSLTNIYSTPDGKYVDKDWDSDKTWSLLWIHIFGLFWVTEFIGYWAYTVMSGAFAEWYFTPWDTPERSSKTIKSNLICNSLYRVTRFHLGTIAFGSAIIAIIKTIRAFLAYIQSKTKDSENCLVTCIYSCIQCILGWLECCIDKINTDGFIFTSIYGSPYCSSCFAAVDILMSNADYAIVMETLSTIIIRLAKYLVAITNAAVMIVISRAAYTEEELNSYVVIGILFFIGGYFIAIIILGVFDTAVESLFICFLTDKHVNRGGELQFASKQVKKLFGEYEKRAKDLNSNPEVAV